MTKDAGEEIVKIMGNSTGQCSDGLHLLGLLKLGHEQLLFGDVPNERHYCRPAFPINDDGLDIKTSFRAFFRDPPALIIIKRLISFYMTLV